MTVQGQPRSFSGPGSNVRSALKRRLVRPQPIAAGFHHSCPTAPSSAGNYTYSANASAMIALPRCVCTYESVKRKT